MANLEKLLNQDAESRRKIISGNEVLKQATQLLLEDGSRDMNMLLDMAPKSSLGRMHAMKGEMLEIENKEKFHSGSVFTREQIINLGVKYRLKFLPSTSFKDYIDPSCIPEIKELERYMGTQMRIGRAKKEGKTVEEYIAANPIPFTLSTFDYKERFFILGPAKSFELTKKAAIVEPVIPKFPNLLAWLDDPILFYKIDDNHYRLVKKWGTDLNITRRIKGFIMTRELNFFLLAILTPALLIAGIVTMLLGPTLHLIWLTIPVVIAGVIQYHYDVFGRDWVTSPNSYFL